MATLKHNFIAFIEGIDTLYDIAKDLGYVQTRGGRGRGGKGNGSPKQMMEAIARGECVVVRLDRLSEREAVRVRKLAE